MQATVHKVESRILTEDEFNSLMSSAPESETENLFSAMERMGFLPYEFFQYKAVENRGIVIDGKPIYFAALVKNTYGEIELWTVVNSDVKEQFSLFKIAHRTIREWIKKYKRIYATMDCSLQNNIRWTERLGFNKLYKQGRYITFLMKEGE